MSDEANTAAQPAALQLRATLDHAIQVIAVVDGDIPKAVQLLNSPAFLGAAGLAHLEPIREELVGLLNFIKRVADALLAIFPAPAPAQ